jgi:pyruvate dehydrogenase E2 component (dihydrolipoyllysine-residue acetyltransferase)
MDVLMPQLGETVAEGKISKWFVKAGDAVKPGDNLFEIETDKVSMEVPAISAGVLSAINVAAGETVPVGAVVAIIQGKDETVSPKQPSPTRQQTSLTPALGSAQGAARGQAPAGVQGPELDSRLRGNERSVAAAAPHAPFKMEPFREVRSPERNYGPARLAGGTVVTPLARRLAGEAGIDLANIKGTGPQGRIVAADVEGAKQTKSAAATRAQAQGVMTIVLTADVEIGQPLALCAEASAIELADVIIKAWATALAHVTPSEDSNIAVVVGKSRAVIGNAAGKSLSTISAARRDAGATDGPQSASTAISVPDVPGITSVTDVVRPPQMTVLSIGAPRRAPVEAADGLVKFVSVITATLNCDGRAIDAVLGAQLLATFKGFVEHPVTMLV